MSCYERVKTGVQELDAMLGGGLLRETVTLVAGNPGTGKSTLATQFILEGIIQGENGAYISLEEEKCKFYRSMRSYGWDLNLLEDEGRLYFESFRTEELLRHITDGYQVIDNELRKIKAKRVVIDSITAYLLASENELGKRNELKRLFNYLRKWGVTTIFTGESGQTDERYGIDFMVDTIIRLHHRIDGESRGRVRYIEVEKMRGSRHCDELELMDITDEGIVVTNTKKLRETFESPYIQQRPCPFGKPAKNTYI